MSQGKKHAARREALRSLYQRTIRGTVGWPEFNDEIGAVLDLVREQTRAEIRAALRSLRPNE